MFTKTAKHVKIEKTRTKNKMYLIFKYNNFYII